MTFLSLKRIRLPEVAITRTRLAILVALVGLSFTSAWLGFSSARSHSSTVGLQPSTAVFDFGAIGQGERHSHVFHLKNVGDENIRIVSVQPSCSCTVATLSQDYVRPELAIPLEVSFDSETSRGRVFSRCNVFFLYPDEKDGRLRHLELRVAASVLPDVQISPMKLSFSRDDLSAELPMHQVILKPGQLKDIDITRVNCTHPAFQAEIQPKTPAGEISIQVTLDTEQWLGYSKQAELLITTNSLKEPVLRIPLYGPPARREHLL